MTLPEKDEEAMSSRVHVVIVGEECTAFTVPTDHPYLEAWRDLAETTQAMAHYAVDPFVQVFPCVGVCGERGEWYEGAACADRCGVA